MFPSSIKREIIGRFTSSGHALTAKKCTKQHDVRTKLLFCQSKPIAFLPFLLPLPFSFIQIHRKSEMQANFPGVDFLGTGLKFRKRKRNSSSLVDVLHKK